MSYRFTLGGVEITCDSAAEVKALIAGGADPQQAPPPPSPPANGPFPRAKPPRRKSVPMRRLGAAKSWQMGKWLAGREGGTAEECRSRLAAMKKADFPRYQQLEAEFLASLSDEHPTESGT